MCLINLKTIGIFLGPSVATLPSEGAFLWGAIGMGPIPLDYVILLHLVVYSREKNNSCRIVAALIY